MTRKAFKYIGILLLALIGLFLLLAFALTIPKVQTGVTNQVAKSLSTSLQAKVHIESVDIEFFKTAVLQGIYIEDQKRDTLLYADRLAVNIGIFSLLQRNIFLNSIALKGAKVKLERTASDSTFNYNFLIQSFQSNQNKTDTAKSPWTFSLEAVSISSSQLAYLDENTETILQATIPDLSITANNLDLEKKIVDLQKVKLDEIFIDFQMLAGKEVVDTTPVRPTLTFPELGWDLMVNQLEIRNNQIIFNQNNPTKSPKEGIDFQHLGINNLFLTIEGFTWIDKEITGEINNFSLQDKSGFELENLTGKLLVDTSQILVENLSIKTPYSRANTTTKLQFKQFADLADITHKVNFESTFNEVSIAFHDLKLFAPAINKIQQLNTNLKEQLFLNGRLKGNANNLTINNFNFSIGEQVELSLNGKLQQLTDINQATFDIELKELTTSYDKVNRLLDSIVMPQGLKEFGQFTLSGVAKGQLNDFNIDNLFLQTASNTNIKANAYLVGLPDAENLRFDLEIAALETRAEDWKGFLNNSIPPVLDSLGDIQFVGKVEGDIKNFDLIGTINSSIGKLESDLKLAFTPNYQSGNYIGDLRLINFELDKAFPQNKALGSATLHAKGQGSGFVVDSLLADAQVIIDSINYNNYTYRNVEIDGAFQQKNFDGKIRLTDKNAKLTFNGQANLQDSIPDFKFVLNLDTLNLKPLNFTSDALAIQLKADIDFSGNSLNNVTGKSVISNFSIGNGVDVYTEDSIFFKATQPTLDSATLSLQADFLKADIKGDFDIAKLSRVTLNYINDFFPLDNLLDTITRANVAAAINDQQSFDFDIQITNPLPLTFLFVPQLTSLEDGTIKGNFNRKKQKLELEAIIDNLEFGNLSTEQLLFKVNGQEEKLNANLSLLQMETGGLFAPLAIFETNLGEDSLRFQLTVTGDTLENRLAFKGVAYETPRWYEFKLTDRFFLNGETWQVAADNGVYFINNYLYINNLKIKDKQHQIAIQSEGSPDIKTITPPIQLAFNDFQINDITNFLAINQNRLKGLINGQFTLKEPLGNAHYVADLQIDDLALNGEKVGQFFVDSEQGAGSKIINVKAGLKGDNNNLSLVGQYTIDTKEFDISGDIQQMEMRLLNPFTEGIINDSKGMASGRFTLEGTPEKPDLSGQINLQQASTIIDFLGSRITIPEHTIAFNNQQITLGSVLINDADNQQGTLTGNIYHDFFADMQLDLRFQTNSFQVMNTTATLNPLFFGQLFVAADVNINGPLTLPFIEVNARTLPNSVFNLQPLIESEQITTDDYIIFTNPEKYAKEGEEAAVPQYELRNVLNVDLLMNLDVTPDALLKIIIDPLTGDQVEGRGSSNMTIALSPAGEMRILGDFVIDQGQYNFSYQNLVKKNFDIQSGSRVSFVGDPLKARFDITAAYNVKTTTYELIKNETNFEGSAEASAARRRTEVQTLLYLKGLFTKPEISFDIRLPEGIGNDVSSTVSRKLNDLRNDQDEMNKQVFSLLLFNSFIASENAGQSIAGAGQNVALSSVSKLLSNQLNQLAGKYLKGFELSFDLASYQSNFEDTAGPAVELGVGLSQKLFNDRITIKADADFNLANQSTSAGSNVAGDFVLEYQLTESGSYLLRVFRLSDFDILTDQNTARTGVGINFRKSFGNVLKKRKNEKN